MVFKLKAVITVLKSIKRFELDFYLCFIFDKTKQFLNINTSHIAIIS